MMCEKYPEFLETAEPNLLSTSNLFMCCPGTNQYFALY